jgi:hypothetical protein
MEHVAMSLNFERLENRVLLAASISQKGATLAITSNNAGDAIAIDGVASNVVDVGGILYLGVENIVVKMNGGNDLLALNEVQVSGKVTIDMGAGLDEVDIDNTGNGVDLGGTFIGGDVSIKFGNNAGDFLDMDANDADPLFFSGNLIIDGCGDINMDGEGGDPIPQEDDILIDGNLTIKTNVAVDVPGDGNLFTMFFDDVSVGQNLYIQGSNAHPDLISFEDTVVAGTTTILTRGNSDAVSVADDANLFLGSFTYDGGAGTNLFISGAVPNDFFLGGITLKKTLTVV